MQRTMMLLLTIVSVLVSGCAVMDSGPTMIGKILTSTSGVTQSLVSRMDPEHISAGAKGSISNPEFQFRWVGGPVYYSEGTLRLVGADTSFDVLGTGTGATFSAERLNQFHQLWQDEQTDMTFGDWYIHYKEQQRLDKQQEADLQKDSDGDGINDDGLTVNIKKTGERGTSDIQPADP